MRVIVNDSALNKKLKNETTIKKSYGQLAGRIIKILSLIDSATNLKELSLIKSLKFHSLVANYKGCYSVWINGNYRMILRPISEEEKVDLKNIIVVEIENIEDYHKK